MATIDHVWREAVLRDIRGSVSGGVIYPLALANAALNLVQCKDHDAHQFLLQIIPIGNRG